MTECGRVQRTSQPVCTYVVLHGVGSGLGDAQRGNAQDQTRGRI